MDTKVCVHQVINSSALVYLHELHNVSFVFSSLVKCGKIVGEMWVNGVFYGLFGTTYMGAFSHSLWIFAVSFPGRIEILLRPHKKVEGFRECQFVMRSFL